MKLDRYRIEVWGEQPHLGYNTYGGFSLLNNEWWRCFRLPSNRWLWIFWPDDGKPFQPGF